MKADTIYYMTHETVKGVDFEKKKKENILGMLSTTSYAQFAMVNLGLKLRFVVSHITQDSLYNLD
jgi:hypothetical protein